MTKNNFIDEEEETKFDAKELARSNISEEEFKQRLNNMNISRDEKERLLEVFITTRNQYLIEKLGTTKWAENHARSNITEEEFKQLLNNMKLDFDEKIRLLEVF